MSSELPTNTTPDWQRALRRAGLRVTAARLAVLEAVAVQPGQHRDAEAITRAATQRLGSLSIQAVYDNLHTLRTAGLVRCIQPAGHPARYEIRTHDNHHHLVCRRCGETVDVDCVIGSAPCLEPATRHGFLVDEAEVIFWGLCSRCQLPSETTSKKENLHE